VRPFLSLPLGNAYMKRLLPPNWRDHHQLILPRWAIPFVWALLVYAIQILLPWAIAKIGPRFGWSESAPGKWNVTGLILVVIGLGLYAWCLSVHFRGYPASVRIGFSPPHLVGTGPYRYSRNPMYVSGLLAWLGWTIFYGSPAVFVVLLLLWSLFAFRVIPHEEHQLEALLGDDYLEYKRSVPRWFGRF
jgi:protein-S-isoprenylcysteine O-methyltransferase Ste14